MKPTSLALAAALATIVGWAQPAAAQTQDRTGVAPADQAAPGDDGNATNGSGRADEDDNWRGGQNGSAGNDGNSRGQARERGPMTMPMRPMMPQRRMMVMGGAGARFHFARGNARIDVTCSAQEDTQACVRAAGELIDKIAELHGAGRDTTTGSDERGDNRPNGTTPGDDDQGALGERM
jgi:hypothetical protein